ncbi:ribosome maturation factor RimP [Gordonia desulfuricans]|uniref:Ribosome maturation factor RimP n=1 Tax=Gordonia desulfuricans TaxID=89051 RepID=A0A7K3LRM4_9ACTN|nr:MULTISPECIES: ribosome maturation factor RimP [Gordonia]KOY49875.1 ribosome maturation factor RimP [Gordonia sp. NB41Y]NDK90903.1 ribosome maturation factor RimP [Gordonia desulfuricans]WLP91159.1 ribosome maturation factor RimP [Gordonia sp. NB41Y]
MRIDGERVRELVEGIVTSRGLDLEDVVVTTSGGQDEIVLIVDRDGGTDLDLLGDLTREINEVLDAHPDVSEDAYGLEITSPGIGRPLTLPRHWRRAQGRKVRIDLTPDAERKPTDDGPITGRIGAITDDAVEIVSNNKGRIGMRSVPFATVAAAAVEVDFSRPSVAELQRCGLDEDEIARRRDSGPTELERMTPTSE